MAFKFLFLQRINVLFQLPPFSCVSGENQREGNASFSSFTLLLLQKKSTTIQTKTFLYFYTKNCLPVFASICIICLYLMYLCNMSIHMYKEHIYLSVLKTSHIYDQHHENLSKYKHNMKMSKYKNYIYHAEDSMIDCNTIHTTIDQLAASFISTVLIIPYPKLFCPQLID